MKVVRVNSAEALEKVIQAYRIQNPVKAKAKEVEWARKLAQLRKGVVTEEVEPLAEPTESVEPVVEETETKVRKSRK